jgi:hypothetical protein
MLLLLLLLLLLLCLTACEIREMEMSPLQACMGTYCDRSIDVVILSCHDLIGKSYYFLFTFSSPCRSISDSTLLMLI